MRRVLSVFAALIALAAFAKPPQEAPKTRLDVASQPAGAIVTVDGVNSGATPTTIFSLAPGRHLVKLSLPGYVEAFGYVDLKDGFPATFSEVMYPEKGLLIVKSDPEECEITIDGAAVGMTPRLITDLNAKDVHRMTLSKTGYKTSTFEIRFNGRRPVVRNETLVRDSGVMHVVSEPAGALVTLNGLVRGKTPLTIDNVPKGNATLKLWLEGFKEEVISDLVINPGDEQTVSRVLEVMPGTLYLSSVPEGARFYLNGEFRGESPLSIPDLTPGEYEVRAEKTGYSVETRKVTVQNGATPREEFRLENTMGRLEVRTSPSGAQVYIDGTLVGTTVESSVNAEFSKVLSIENLSEGEHVLVVSKKGHAEQTRHPKIRSRKTSTAKVRLKRVFEPDVELTTITGTYKGMLVDETPDFVIVEVALGIQRSFPQADILSVRPIKDGGR